MAAGGKSSPREGDTAREEELGNLLLRSGRRGREIFGVEILLTWDIRDWRVRYPKTGTCRAEASSLARKQKSAFWKRDGLEGGRPSGHYRAICFRNYVDGGIMHLTLILHHCGRNLREGCIDAPPSEPISRRDRQLQLPHSWSSPSRTLSHAVRCNAGT